MDKDPVNSKGATHVDSERSSFVPYTIEFDRHSGILSGIIPVRPVSPNNPEGIDLNTIDSAISKVSAFKIQQYLESHSYHQFYFATNIIENFVRRIKRSQSGKIELGQRKDAEVKITTSNDKLRARAQSSHAWGGTRLTREKIEAAIKKARLDQSLVIQDAFDKLLTSDKSLDLVIAKAIPAKNGENASVNILVKSKNSVAHDTESLKAIDQHDVFDYTLVEPNSPLAIKTPATLGKDGLNVLGKPIKAKKGKDVKLPKLAGGVELSKEDKHIVVASIKGHPVVNSLQAKVDPILTIKEVGLASGHIDYDGSVIVTGRIRSGYNVKATGDIFVQGFVSKSTLSAGGGIFIQGGVQGDIHNDEHTSVLIAKNDIELKFGNQIKINCGGVLRVKEYLINCSNYALGGIIIGEHSKHGALIGGSTQSYRDVHVKSLGSDAFIKTQISLGVNTHAQKELNKYQGKRTQRFSEAEKLKTILNKLRSNDSPSSIGRITLDKERKIEATLEAIAKCIADYDTQIEKLELQVPSSTPLKIRIDKIVFPNVEVSINEASYMIHREYKNVFIEREDETITIKPNT